MAAKIQVSVNQELCVGNAVCVRISPKVFALNDRRQSQAVNPEGDSSEAVLQAAETCPVGAITVRDADTGEQLFP